MESDDNPNDLKINTYKKFISNSTDIEIKRMKNINTNKFNSKLKKYKELNPQFDYSFLLTNENNKLYCSEFINVIYKEVIGKNIFTYLHTIMGISGITIKSIYENKSLNTIYKKSF